MTEDSSKNPGCLAVIFGILIMIYAIYTPVYFVFLNDEIDSFQEASLIDMIVDPLKVGAGGSARAEKFISGLEDALAKTRERVEGDTGVDMGRTFESALKRNDRISDINWSRSAASAKGVVEVTVTLKHRDHGAVSVSAAVKERSFLGVTLSEFLFISAVHIEGEYYSANSVGAYVAIASLYGLEEANLREFGQALQFSGMF